MLLPLSFDVTLFAQSPVPAQAAPQADKTSQRFVVTVPPSRSQSLHFQSSRSPSLHFQPLISLTATMTLDREAEAAREEQDLVAAINTERTSRGLDALSLDPVLCEAARAHSREMCDLNYFAHQSPTSGDKTPIDRYLGELHTDGEKRPNTALVGENIFYASVTNAVYGAGYAHRRLMASPSHRENILEPRFTKVGVGLYRDLEGRFWVTEMFLRDS